MWYDIHMSCERQLPYAVMNYRELVSNRGYNWHTLQA